MYIAETWEFLLLCELAEERAFFLQGKKKIERKCEDLW